MLALTLLALRLMFGKFEASQQARIDDGKLYAGALKDSAKATEKNNETLADLAAVPCSTSRHPERSARWCRRGAGLTSAFWSPF